jgi:hypothetical protein
MNHRFYRMQDETIPDSFFLLWVSAAAALSGTNRCQELSDDPKRSVFHTGEPAPWIVTIHCGFETTNEP